MQRQKTAPTEKPKEGSKSKIPSTGGKVTNPRGSEKEKEAFAIVEAVENKWKTLEAVAAPYDPLKLWLLHGNTIVTLIRLHTTAALNATQANDSELAAGYLHAVETDNIAFDYVVWHVIAYVNLLSLRLWPKKLINSFDHDNRPFTGRKNAERITRELQQAINELPAKSNDDLGLITYPLLAVRAGKPQEYSILVTSAAIRQVAPLLLQQTAAMKKLQIEVQLGVEFIDQFLDDAFEEGLQQAGDALKEYWKVRGALGGPKSERETSRRPQEDKQPTPIPRPAPPEEEERRKKSGDCCGAPMPNGEEFKPRRGKYKGKTLTIRDSRVPPFGPKHVRNALRTGNQSSCDNSYLKSAKVNDKEDSSPCLRAWIQARDTGDTALWGSQMGEDSLANYKAIAREIVEDGTPLRGGNFHHDVGQPVGVDVSTKDVTTKGLVRGAPNECHIVPQEKPT